MNDARTRMRSGARIVSWTCELSRQVEGDTILGFDDASNRADFLQCCDVLRERGAGQNRYEYKETFHSFLQDLQDVSGLTGLNLVNPEKSCKSCLTIPSTRGAQPPASPHHPHTSHARSSRARPATETHAPQPAGACASQTDPNHSPPHHQSRSSRDSGY